MLQILVLFVTQAFILLNKDIVFNVHKDAGSVKIFLAKFVQTGTSIKLENVLFVLLGVAIVIPQHVLYVHRDSSFPVQLPLHLNLNLNLNVKVAHKAA